MLEVLFQVIFWLKKVPNLIKSMWAKILQFQLAFFSNLKYVDIEALKIRFFLLKKVPNLMSSMGA